jgi:hypothetical protein
MDVGLDKTMGSGQWIWDLEDATRMEGNKQAQKLSSCADLAFTTYPNLGWCPSTGRGILTDGAGNPAFPQDPNGDCPGGGIIMSAAQCQQAAAGGGGGGAPGGSGSGGIAGLCSTSPMSPGCIQSVVSQSSCSASGGLAQSLSSGYPGTSSQFNAIYKFVQPQFQLPPAIMSGAGSPSDVASAATAFRQFAQTATGRAGSAAANLCFNTPFNPCALNPTDTGPFDDTCITQMAMGSYGFAAQGTALPGNSESYWPGAWSDVVAKASYISQCADDPAVAGSAETQANCVRWKYGVSVKYPKQGCNNYGIFMYRYFFPTWDQSLFPIQGPQTHFMGRYIFKNGFPYKGSTYEDQTPAGGYLTEGQRYTTVFYPQQGGQYQFMLVSDDGVRLQINGKVILDWHYCCGPPGYSDYIQLEPGQPYLIQIDLWNGGGPWAFQISASVNGGPFGDMPMDLKELQLPQDRRLPMIEYAFNKMPSDSASQNNIVPIQDTSQIFSNMVRNAPIGQLNGRQCMLVNQGTSGPSGLFNYNKYTQGIRLCAIKSFTMMIQINSQTTYSTSPSLFSMFNLPESITNNGSPRGGWQTNYVQTYTQRVNDFMITAYNGTIYPWGYGVNPGQSSGMDYFFGRNRDMGAPAYPANQWFHLAFVWDDDFNGYTMYINGTEVLRGFVPAYDPQLIMEQIRIGSDSHADGQWWSGGIAWFRAFDYRLGTDLITRDMNDDWANLI